MKILLMSDSHTKNNFNEIIEIINPDYTIHAGDSQVYDEKDLSNYFNKYVKGNCDFIKIPIVENFEIEQYKIGLTHGHLFNVNYDDDELLSEFDNSDIIIHGHTHVVRKDIIDNKLILNPGSTTQSRSKYPTTYMVLELIDDVIKINIYDAKIHKIYEQSEVRLNVK